MTRRHVRALSCPSVIRMLPATAEEESITASGELFHYLQDVSSPSAASATETFYARPRLPRELWTAPIYIDGASSSTLSPRIFPSCRIENIMMQEGGREYTGDGYACNERAINASLDAISHVYFQLIRISLSNMKEVSRHSK